MDFYGAVDLAELSERRIGRPGVLASAVLTDELGDGRLRYKTQTLLGYDKRGRPIYQAKGGSAYTWQESVAWAEADGAALSGTAAASLIPAAAKYTFPANFFQVGRIIRITGKGRISNIVTTPGTLTLDSRLGAVIVFNGGAMQLNAVAKTNVTFIFDALLTCRNAGSGTTANFIGIGQFTSESVVGSPVPGTGGSGSLLCPASAPAVGTGFDSTAAQTADFFGTFSLTGNGLTLHEYLLESLN